jgi:hypothetical protein
VAAVELPVVGRPQRFLQFRRRERVEERPEPLELPGRTRWRSILRLLALAAVAHAAHPDAGEALGGVAGVRPVVGPQLPAQRQHRFGERVPQHLAVGRRVVAVVDAAVSPGELFERVGVGIELAGGDVPRRPAGPQFRGRGEQGLCFRGERTRGGERGEHGSTGGEGKGTCGRIVN